MRSMGSSGRMGMGLGASLRNPTPSSSIGGGGGPPPTYTPALKFNDQRNSMYVPLVLSVG